MASTHLSVQTPEVEDKTAAVLEIPLSSRSAPLEEGTPAVRSDGNTTNYLQGLKLHTISVTLCLCLLLVNLEISIVSTSLVGITNSLHGFGQSSWIVTAYLLTYVGFLIICAKLSDIYGRKLSVCIAVFIFALSSAACGAAQTVTQLIVFRAFQGIGGSGIYSLSTIIFFELVPPERFASYMSFVSSVFALSLLLGPILGGAINSSSTWRWIFLLNVPAGTVAIIVLIISIPAHFPYHGQPSTEKRKIGKVFSRETMKRLDILGAALLLVAILLLVTALEEAGIRFPWKSPFVIILLTVSGLLWIVFLAWERRLTRAASVQEPVFPWRFVQSRVWVGMLLNSFLLGAPFTVAVFQIPQRSQIVNGASPLGAGIRLLPFAFASPVGSIVSAMIAGKLKVPPIYLVLIASTLQVIGFTLLSTLPTSGGFLSHAQYGYEVIAGFGVGVNISTLMLMTPFSVEKRDQAVAVGAVAQFRVMGAAIGLGIVTSVLNNFVTSRLAQFLSPSEVGTLLQTSAALSNFHPEQQNMIRSVFAEGYNLQMRILIGFAAAQLPASLVMWQKKQIVV